VRFVVFSKLQRRADDVYGADTACVADSCQQKVTLSRAVRLLNELAETLSALEEPDPT